MQPFKYKPKLNAGDMRQTLIFQYEGEGQDEEGYPSTVAIDYISTKAKLRTLKGRTFYAAAQENMENSREFTIRYRKALDENSRPSGLFAVWNDKRHEIVSIENDDGLNATMTVFLKVVD